MNEHKTSMSWGHININVSDLDRSIAFYEQLGFTEFLPSIPYLGLGRDSSSPVDAELVDALELGPGTLGRACIMRLGDGFPMLDLTEFNTSDPHGPLANSDVGVVRICLVAENLAAEVERLEAAGIGFLSSPVEGVGALADIAVCQDPDGTLIEIIQVHLKRWASVLNSSPDEN